MRTNIIRLTGLATAAVALGACGAKVSEAEQRGAIIERNVNSCIQGFEQRRSQTPGVTPAGLETRRFCDCAVAKVAEGKSTDELKALDSDHSLTPTAGRIVSECLDQEARRAGVIEADAPAAPANRSAGSSTQNSSAAAATPPPSPGPTPTPTPARAERTPPRTPPAATPRPHSSDPIATPVSTPRPATPPVPPGFSPSPPRPATPTTPRPATPTPPAATPRPSGPTSLLPRGMTPPPAPARTPSTRPPPEG